MIKKDVSGQDNDNFIGGEIDFETKSNIYECGINFDGKGEQLVKLCVVARLRGKPLIGVIQERADNDSRIKSRLEKFSDDLARFTFSSPEAQKWLNHFADDPSLYTDDRPLSDWFVGFQDINGPRIRLDN